jgi:hypothetical protein
LPSNIFFASWYLFYYASDEIGEVLSFHSMMTGAPVVEFSLAGGIEENNLHLIIDSSFKKYSNEKINVCHHNVTWHDNGFCRNCTRSKSKGSKGF